MTTDGCIDKSDLRARAKEGLERLKLPGAKLGPVSKPIVIDIVSAELDVLNTTPAAQEVKVAEAKAKWEVQKAEEEKAAAEAEAAAKAAAFKEKAEKDAAAWAATQAERKKKQEAAASKANAEQAAMAAVEAVKKGNIEEALRLFRDQPLGANCKGEYGDTPLHVAAGKGFTDMMEALFAAGADPNIANDEGQTPIHHAAVWGRIDAAKLLVAKGVDPSLVDKSGQTPMVYAELNKRDEMAALLREAIDTKEARSAEAQAKVAAEKAAREAEFTAAMVATKLVGKQVRVDGLKARPELNGKVGYVLNAVGNGRCTVAIKTGTDVEQVALKPANLSLFEGSVDIS